MRRFPLLAAALAALALSACQPLAQKAQNEQTAAGDVCSQLGAVAAALEQVNALKPTSTVGEAQSANQALSQAIKGLKGAESSLERARMDAFQARLKAFRKEVAKVSRNKGLTLEQAAVDLRAKAAPVIAARKELSAAVTCREAAKP
jgi:hypothetical protein